MTPAVTTQRLVIQGLALVAAVCLARQVRKPAPWIGVPFAMLMNRTHSALTDWGLGHVRIEPRSVVLDVGCGGGRTIEKIAAVATEGRVAGVDYAAGSVAASRAKNKAAIAAGRVEMHRASVSELPFDAATFDLVTAIETHYYWPDPVEDLREIHRVLKPGGTLLLVAEAYADGRNGRILSAAMRLLGSKLLTAEGHRDLLRSAGFAEVEVFEQGRRGWIAVRGR